MKSLFIYAVLTALSTSVVTAQCPARNTCPAASDAPKPPSCPASCSSIQKRNGYQAGGQGGGQGGQGGGQGEQGGQGGGGGGGGGQDTTTNYMANAVCVLTNSVRFNPDKYKSTYKSQLTCQPKKGLKPMFVEPQLVKSSKYNSDELARVKSLSHNSQQSGSAAKAGDSFEKKIKSYFKKGETVGENIGKGSSYNDPVKCMNGWLKSQTHCNNIFGEKYNMIGASVTKSDAYYAAQHFGEANKNNIPSRVIACAAHIPEGDRLSFQAVVVGQQGGTVQLVLNGQRQTMTLEVGQANQGVYKIYGNADKGRCSEYYFEVQGGKTERYPKTGTMKTEGWGQCQGDGGKGGEGGGQQGGGGGGQQGGGQQGGGYGK